MKIILANDGIEDQAKTELEEAGFEVDTNKYEGEALLSRLGEVDAVVVRSATKLRDPEIDAGAAGNLKLIIRGGVGVDNINVDYAESRGITVRNTPEASTNAVAELVLAHMFANARRIYEATASMREGKWLKKELVGTEIAGKTLGLIGFGRIGQSLAQKAGCLGMKVIFHRRTQDFHFEGAVQKSKAEVLREADYLVILISGSVDKPLVGAEEIATMKDSAFIINTARGGVVDEDALVDAIEVGKLKGAGGDVYVSEPCKNERLLACPHVTLTPHVGAATKEAQQRIGEEIVRIAKEVL
ncbi:MAG: 3-phosphoglycerate dehydrogenase [Clostridiaceae bacterium]|nr:3-phosphoglycerate dehydrogenase [Clostridiaceae bacterium]NLC90068.1 3-phosphoglycerate dehydrogenase [Clostridiaceae bacterium]